MSLINSTAVLLYLKLEEVYVAGVEALRTYLYP